MLKIKKLLIIFLVITSKLVILANERPNIIFLLAHSNGTGVAGYHRSG